MKPVIVIILAVAFTSAFVTPSCRGTLYRGGRGRSSMRVKVEEERQQRKQTKQTERQQQQPQLQLQPDVTSRRRNSNNNNNNNNKACPKRCSQCSPYNGCIVCRPRNFLLFQWQNIRQTATCVSSCPRGYYPKVWNSDDEPAKRHGKCSKCTQKNCERCRSKDRCAVCSASHLLYRGQCLKRCPPKTQLLHPEDRRCRKLSRGDCKATSWSKWSKCIFKSSSSSSSSSLSSCVGFQTRSRSFVHVSLIHGLKWVDGVEGINLLRRSSGKANPENVKKVRALTGNQLLKRKRKRHSPSTNELPLGSNSTLRHFDLDSYEVAGFATCPEPEFEYRKCYREDCPADSKPEKKTLL